MGPGVCNVGANVSLLNWATMDQVLVSDARPRTSPQSIRAVGGKSKTTASGADAIEFHAWRERALAPYRARG